MPRTPDDFLNSVDEMDTGGQWGSSAGLGGPPSVTQPWSPCSGAKLVGKKTCHDSVKFILIEPALFLYM